MASTAQGSDIDDSELIDEPFPEQNVEATMKGNEAFNTIKRELDTHLLNYQESTQKDERELKEHQHTVMAEPNFNNFVSTNYRMFSRDSPMPINGEVQRKILANPYQKVGYMRTNLK